MNFATSLFVFLLVGTAAVWAEDIDESDVVVLTEDNFQSTLDDNEFVLVEFYAPWCGHCKRLAPEYAKAATALKDEGVVLGKVDATVESSLATSHGVRGYPTLKFFRNGEEVEYDGPREAEGIKKWCMKKTGPPATTLEGDAAVKEFLEREGTQVVGYFKEQDDDAHKAFVAAALKSELGDFEFGVVFGSGPRYTINRENAEVVASDEEQDTDALAEWILNEGFPVLAEFGQSTFQRAQKLSMPLCALFAAEDDTDALDLIEKVATAYKGKIIFTPALGSAHEKTAEQWGASGKKFPTVVFIDLRPEAAGGARPIAFREGDDFTEETVTTYVEEVMKGEYAGFRKSEEAPEDNDGPVRVVVGSAFEEDVFQDDKDVFVEFYAPWCGHCKRLAPTWDKLGEALADTEGVVIAKIDATANGFPDDIEVRGFPTLFYFKAGSKEAIPYSGERAYDDLAAFIKETSEQTLPEGFGDAVEEEDDAEDAEDAEEGDDKEEL